MNNLIPYLPILLKGTLITIFAWLISVTISLLIGIALGIASSKKLGLSKTRKIIRIYTFIAKGVPAYVQILIAYFVIPAALGINVSGLAAACGALGFCSGGYITEIIKSAINSIPSGQWDASVVLAYPLPATLKRIILPQAICLTMPALIGELEQLLKSTSLLATIGVTELTRTGMNIISRELNPIPIYTAIAIIYLSLSGILNIITIYTERKINYGNR